MDTSFWTQLHPKVTIKESKQMLYGKYPYRMVVTCNGAAMLRTPTESFEDQISWSRTVNYGGSWRSRKRIPVADELSFLAELLPIREKILNADESQLKMRIEDPHIQFYSTDEKLLQDLALELFAKHNPEKFLTDITLPLSQQTLDLISQGYSLKNSAHSCRIHLRDGRYPMDSRISLLKYLDSLGDVVTVPLGTREMLNRDRGDFMWGAYFYSNDEKIVMMVNLINPRFVRTVERYHSIDK